MSLPSFGAVFLLTLGCGTIINSATLNGLLLSEGDIVKLDVLGSSSSPPEFVLCPRRSSTCTTVIILGVTDDLRISYIINTNTDTNGKGGTRASETILNEHTGQWPSRSLVYVVQRRSLEWIAVHPEDNPSSEARVMLGSLSRVVGMTVKGAMVHHVGTDSATCRRCRMVEGVYEVCKHTSGSHEPGAFALRRGVATVVGPEERISERLKCDEGHAYCELGFDVVKQYETQTTWSVGAEAGVAVTFGVDFIVELETTVHGSLSGSYSEGWSRTTANTTSFHCQPNGGFTSWLTVKPEFYIKEAVVVKDGPGCDMKMLKVMVPRVRADGSIAGERHCKAEKNTR